MIKNVVLDMGNVLLDFNPEFVMNTFCSSDEEKEIIERELFNGPEWALGDKGDIKDKDRFDLVKVRVPEKYHESLKKCADNWDVCMNPLEGAREFCEYVKDHGYGIYVSLMITSTWICRKVRRCLNLKRSLQKILLPGQ